MIKRLDKQQMAKRLAMDIPAGSYVNIGIGMPELVIPYLDSSKEIILHSENGILGMGPPPHEDEEDLELINAGKRPVTLLAGGAFFHHADSFTMIRGGHLDLCVMGAFQVSARGDLANWSSGKPGEAPAVGGAMDLAVGAKSIYILMTHTDRNGEPKIVDKCTMPITGTGIVRRIYTDLAVMETTEEGLRVIAMNEGLSFDALQSVTKAELIAC